MTIKSERLHDSRPDISKAKLVMNVCLLSSVVVGAVLMLLAVIGNRSILDAAGSVIPLVGLQLVFYLLARARRNSSRTENGSNEPRKEVPQSV